MSVSFIRQAPHSLGVQMQPQWMKAQQTAQQLVGHISGTWATPTTTLFSSAYREPVGGVQNSGDFNSEST